MLLIKFKDFFLFPNILSFLRIFITLPILFVINPVTNFEYVLLITLLLFAAATDYFDGYFSRKFNQVTELGKVLDPVADKISMGAILLSLIFIRDFPPLLVYLLLYRDILIVLFGIIIAQKIKSTTSADFIGKLNTTIIAITILLFVLKLENYFFTFFYFLSILFILLSGIHYYLKGEKILLEGKRFRWPLRISIIVISIFIILWISNIEIQKIEKINYSIEEEFVNRDSLINKYSPIIYHSTKEDYYPIAVESFLDNSLLMNSNLFVFDKTLGSGSSLYKNSNLKLDNNHYLKINRDLTSDIKTIYDSIKHLYPLTVYARAMKVNSDSGTTYVLQYWLFYWASTVESITWHECDWEMVMYLLDEGLNPINSCYSQHYYGQIKRWDETIIEDNRPVIFSSLGAHSLYFNSGEHVSYLDNSKKLPLGKDICEKGFRLGPENYKLVILNESYSWMRFKGRWGLPITTNLEGPKFRHPKNPDLSMWNHPLEWIRKYESTN